jgi:hypothetical protein
VFVFVLDDKGGSDGRMACERDFGCGCEDSYIVAAVAGCVGEDEGRFGEVELPRNLLHLRRGQIAGIHDHGKLIACVFVFSEDIENVEGIVHVDLFQNLLQNVLSTY